MCNFFTALVYRTCEVKFTERTSHTTSAPGWYAEDRLRFEDAVLAVATQAWAVFIAAIRTIEGYVPERVA